MRSSFRTSYSCPFALIGRVIRFLIVVLLLAFVVCPPLSAQAPIELAPVVDASGLRKRPILKQNGDVLVVCPPTLSGALEPWIQYRQKQGYRITLVESRTTADDQLEVLRQMARTRQVRYLVLVGDTYFTPIVDPLVRASTVPTFAPAAKINVQWGSEPEIGSDHPYADLDGDGKPEVAVGRISVDTAGQLSRIIDKIIRFENAARNAAWRRRINFVAGAGGFGPISDALIETSAKRIITDEIPPEYRTTMTYGSWRSPYCPSPRDFRVTALNRLNEGGLFWVYMGHGRLERLARIKVQDRISPVFEADDHQFLNCASGHPIAVLLACYTGAFDHNLDCLAEDLVRNPGGPVAAIAGSRMTMPYGMAVMGMGLLESYFTKRPETLGDVFLYAKQQLLAEDPSQSRNRKLLDAIARAVSPAKDDLADERAEHVLLFNLFGDPLLQLSYPRRVKLAAPNSTIAGKLITVQGHSEIAGACHVELICRRDRTTSSRPRRMRIELTEENLRKMNETYRAVNDDRWTHFVVRVPKGRFQFKLPVPTIAQGPSHIRAFVQGTGDHALGATDIYIRQPTAEKQSTKLR